MDPRQAQRVARAAEERGDPVPAEILAALQAGDDETEVWPVSEPYWRAWNTLSGSRPMMSGMAGAAALPIPFSETAAYARAYGLELDECVQFVGAMDQVYLEHAAKGREGK